MRSAASAIPADTSFSFKIQFLFHKWKQGQALTISTNLFHYMKYLQNEMVSTMSEYTDKFIILSNAARELIYLLNRNGIPRATLGLNSFEWEIFAFLGLGTYGMKFLSEYFQKNYSTMTGVMDRLEEKEVIVRVADKSDRRAVGIKLTEEWQQKYNELAERQERSAQITYEAITGKKFDALLKLLQETNDCMSKRFDLVETNDE